MAHQSGEQALFSDCGVLAFHMIDHAAGASGGPGLDTLLRESWSAPGTGMRGLLASLSGTP